MIARIIEFSLKQRWLVAGMTLVLAGCGIWAAVRLPIDAFPDVSNVQIGRAHV